MLVRPPVDQTLGAHTCVDVHPSRDAAVEQESAGTA